jgi:hypothetical protein
MNRFVAALIACAVLLTVSFAHAETLHGPIEAGEAIYRDGRLPDATALTGYREGGASISGSQAACVKCHRPSGLGNLEGVTVVPPIVGKFLYRSHREIVENLDLPHPPGFIPERPAYTPETLARAIREGVRADGQTMSYLMPRYPIDAGAMNALSEYLSNLGTAPVPGVTDSELHFATIVTPESDPIARQGMLDVLQRFFAVQTQIIAADKPALKSSREIMYRVTRHWRLHVWELKGPPSDWQAQLRAHLAAEPVFAVISGIGGRHWEPIHQFCEAARLPCLLPNVMVPIVRETDFYSVYYSRGVLLESELIAHDLDALQTVHRVVEIYRADTPGEDGARALHVQRAKASVALRSIDARAPASAISGLLRAVDSDDTVVLWLSASDLGALPHDPPPARRVYVSGLMGGLETAPLSARWRDVSHMTYPVDLPERRRVRMNFPLGWFRVQNIPVVDERVQTDTYLACMILSETLGHMLDSFVRDFLVERTEMMLGKRLINAYYPRLSLAAGQRFASKGGYIVKLDAADPSKVAPDTDWLVP